MEAKIIIFITLMVWLNQLTIAFGYSNLHSWPWKEQLHLQNRWSSHRDYVEMREILPIYNLETPYIIVEVIDYHSIQCAAQC